MEQYCLDREALTQIINLIEQQSGPNCEVVLHDLSGTYDRTIVDIRNGHITGRKIGDCGSNLGLEVIRGTVKDGDRFNYVTNTRDGKILRSSTIYLKDTTGKVRHALCVNLDISDSLKFETFLKNINQYEIPDDREEEIFVNNVQDLLGELLKRGIELIGKEPSEMNKDEKMALLEYLDKRGAFLISKSGERVCEELHISKFTFYNYLETVRGNGGGADGAAKEKRQNAPEQ